jgi:hypothetical protein
MNGDETLFGVNFADGRIKGYGYRNAQGKREKKFYARYVRGGPYCVNDFRDNGDGTISDLSTGLTWCRSDSGRAMTWGRALEYAESMVFAGHDDWRLPNARELQSIVDYSRSPDTTGSGAIDPVFSISEIKNEAGERDFPWFWTSTTHLDGPRPGSAAVYVAFGRALGKMRGRIMDVHGAGSQRSDPKIGKTAFRGPQGDLLRITNYVRCVRGGNVFKVGNVESDGKAVSGHKGQLSVLNSDDSTLKRYPYYLNPAVFASGGVEKKSVAKSGNSRMSRFIQRLDRDGDGLVSRREFDGPPDRFNVHDIDGDGFISSDEAPKGPPGRPSKRGGRGR